eukprot:6367246-Lingulodinium_polyedra.AAC.1
MNLQAACLRESGRLVQNDIAESREEVRKGMVFDKPLLIIDCKLKRAEVGHLNAPLSSSSFTKASVDDLRMRYAEVVTAPGQEVRALLDSVQ